MDERTEYIRSLEAYIGWIQENFAVDLVSNPMRFGDDSEEYLEELERYIDSIAE